MLFRSDLRAVSSIATAIVRRAAISSVMASGRHAATSSVTVIVRRAVISSATVIGRRAAISSVMAIVRHAGISSGMTGRAATGRSAASRGRHDPAMTVRASRVTAMRGHRAIGHGRSDRAPPGQRAPATPGASTRRAKASRSAKSAVMNAVPPSAVAANIANASRIAISASATWKLRPRKQRRPAIASPS